jgi:hypothetical protein
MKQLAAVVLLPLAACYGAAPGAPPRVPLPPVIDGAEVAVHTETRTEIENVQKQASTCPQGHGPGDPACAVTTYTVAEPVTRTTSTASYAEQPISFAQFKVLTDPKWNEKLALLDELATKCQHANIPRYAGLGSMLGGLVAGMIVGGDTGKVIVYGGFGVGASSYALGYFAFGGADCVRAQNLYNELDMSQEMSWNSVEGGERASEMKSLAEQFNAQHGGRRSAMRMR